MNEDRNRLADAASPYLRQHADNPVHWREWDADAFERARETGRPVFLSIGYAACHWCHVMAHESFESEAVATVLNRDFVSIKVDREERPDVDQIYMNALQALGEQGGWPLSMFLDADGRPFWGGTYFPPETRYGRPGFREVLNAVRRTWDTDRSRIEHNASGLSEHLNRSLAPPDGAAEVNAASLDDHAERVLSLVDMERGGLSGAPKFPNAPITELHYRAWLRTGDVRHREAFERTLVGMAQGGIFDHFGGGLARYSTDARWLVPHFEKMLYDNAHLLMQASWSTDPRLRERVRSTIRWLDREMRTQGAFAASLDADTEGEEGLTYTWTPDEVVAVLGDDAAKALEAFRIGGEPNFDGRWIPHRAPDAPPLDERLRALAERLLAARNERPQPARDDKVLTDWNTMLVQGLVANAEQVPEALDEAKRVFGAVRVTPLKLVHSRLGERTVGPALLSDHVETALAALALFARTCDPEYAQAALDHVAEIERHYLVDGLPVLTHEAAEDLLVRPSAFNDDPNPSSASRLSVLLTRLDALDLPVNETLKDRLEKALAAHLRDAGFGTAGAANALDGVLRASTLVLHAAPAEWREAVAQMPDPARMDIHSTAEMPLPDWHPAHLLCGGAEPVAVLCRDRACLPPARDLAALEALLRPSRP